jgi:hypothetical protein
MKGVERTKGCWFGYGRSGRKARRSLERRIRRIAKRQLARQEV